MCRDSEASAPAEFPPEQPEADLVADGDQYGADEAEEEAALEAAEGEGDAKAKANPGEDSEMAGVETENGQDDDELSDEDGSVDIEGESDDELEGFEEDEEEGQSEGEAQGEGHTGGDDAMDVDSNDKAAAPAAKPVTVAS